MGSVIGPESRWLLSMDLGLVHLVVVSLDLLSPQCSTSDLVKSLQPAMASESGQFKPGEENRAKRAPIRCRQASTAWSTWMGNR